MKLVYEIEGKKVSLEVGKRGRVCIQSSPERCMLLDHEVTPEMLINIKETLEAEGTQASTEEAKDGEGL